MVGLVRCVMNCYKSNDVVFFRQLDSSYSQYQCLLCYSCTIAVCGVEGCNNMINVWLFIISITSAGSGSVTLCDRQRTKYKFMIHTPWIRYVLYNKIVNVVFMNCNINDTIDIVDVVHLLNRGGKQHEIFCDKNLIIGEKTIVYCAGRYIRACQ